MSGRIRRNLNAALKTIQEHTAEANRIIGEENDEDTRRKLKLEKAHIETTIGRIEELDSQWSDYVTSLEGPQKMAEESLYLDFPPLCASMEREEGQEVPLAQRHFVDQCEFARQVVVLIEQTMEDLGHSRSGSRQSAMSEVSDTRTADLGNQNRRVQGNQRPQPPTIQMQQPFMVQPRAKLPPLPLPHFSGETRDWPTFWQLFESTVDNEPSYDNVVKMSYLLSLLDRPVQNVVAGYLPTNENYPRVVKLLKARYGDKRALKESLQSELYHLPHANDSVMELRKFLDIIERVCRQLTDYGISDDSWIVFTIKEKLPRGILAKLIEKERVAEQTWNVEMWRNELDLLISVKKEVQRCSVNKEFDWQQRRDRCPLPNPEQTHSFPVTSHPMKPFFSLCEGNHLPSECPKDNNLQARKDRLQEQNRCLKCILCRGNHPPSHCSKYSSPKAKKYKLLEQNRCLNCLSDGHRTFDCRNNRRCIKCRGKHHVMVCYSRMPKTQLLEPMRKSEVHCSRPAGMFEAKKMLEEKTKALQEKDKTIVKLMSELMLARKKAEDESKKAKRFKRLLDQSNQRIVDDYGKRILKETHVNALQKANRKLIARNGKLEREVHAYRKKCQLEKLEPPDFYAFCRSWIDMKMFVLVLAAFVMILDGTKNALRMIIRATNKFWKCKTKERMEQEMTSKHGLNRARIKRLLRASIALTLFTGVVAINPCGIFVAILFSTMDGWAHALKESRRCAMEDVPKIKKRKKILERWKKEIEDETLDAGGNVAKRLKMRNIK
ncbi:unnamed protein product [Meloidogyne enterolobii]|uniref:Uncharacterized protein n=1 Tax=Meloidogyne enterolobii TaxID=390850 RepID=A0ACB0ZPK6_MELEN